VKTINPDNFKYRVDYAAQCFTKGIQSRSFDNCFEMFDGDAVIVALIRRANKNERLKQAIRRGWSEFGPMGFPVSWENVYNLHKDIKDLVALAKQMRESAGRKYGV
jgi:hypothetical protein